MNPQRMPDFAVQDIGGETILYSKENEAIHVLNQTAMVIWNLCDGLHSLEDIELALRDSFAIKEGHDVAGDIRRTLAVFQAKGLIQSVRETEG